MSKPDPSADVEAIEAIISRQFGSLCWTEDSAADWSTFSADFLPDAPLFPSARPVKPQSVDAFVERLSDLAESKLRTFHEQVLGSEIRVFGNVAVAAVGCAITENETTVNRGVEMLLLVKDEGHWQIAAQGWDMATDELALPASLARANAPED